MAAKLSGGCYCGAARYEVADAFGYDFVFGASIGLLVAAFLALMTIKDPRRRKTAVVD